MNDLITCLEAAEAGSRTSNIALFLEVQATVDVPEDFKRHVEQAMRSGSDSRAMGYLLLAALTLVPEGWYLDCLTTGDADLSNSNPARRPRALICPNLKNDNGWKYGSQKGAAATPALALCIAALKAREAVDG